jgi:hypothetical protein
LIPPKNRTSKSFGKSATSAAKSVWPALAVQRLTTAPPAAVKPLENWSAIPLP